MPAILMFSNLTEADLRSGNGRLLLTIPLKNKVIAFCSRHQISAHALPRNAEEMIDFISFLDWDAAIPDVELMRPLCTKLLDFVRNNVNPDKLRPGLIETQDPSTKEWKATWKVFTQGWMEEGGFMWGKTVKELDLEKMSAEMKMDRVQEVRPYIAPAALVRQTVAYVENAEFEDAESDDESVTEVSGDVHAQAQANRLAEARRHAEANRQAEANRLAEVQRLADAQRAEAQRAEAQRVEAQRVEAQRAEAQRLAGLQRIQDQRRANERLQAEIAEARRIQQEQQQAQVEEERVRAQQLATQHARELANARAEAQRVAAAEAKRAAEAQLQEEAKRAAEAKKAQEAQHAAEVQHQKELQRQKQAQDAAFADLDRQRIEMESYLQSVRDQIAAANMKKQKAEAEAAAAISAAASAEKKTKKTKTPAHAAPVYDGTSPYYHFQPEVANITPPPSSPKPAATAGPNYADILARIDARNTAAPKTTSAALPDYSSILAKYGTTTTTSPPPSPKKKTVKKASNAAKKANGLVGLRRSGRIGGRVGEV